MHSHALSNPTLVDRHALVTHLLQRHEASREQHSRRGSANTMESSSGGLTGRSLAAANEASEAAAVLRASISAGETLHLRKASAPALHTLSHPSQLYTQISSNSAAVVARARALRSNSSGGGLSVAASASAQVGASPTAAAPASSSPSDGSSPQEWTAAMLGLTSSPLTIHPPPLPSSQLPTLSPPPGAPYTREEFALSVKALKEKKQARTTRRKDPTRRDGGETNGVEAGAAAHANEPGSPIRAKHILTHIPPQPHLLLATQSRISHQQQHKLTTPVLSPEALAVASAPMNITSGSHIAVQQRRSTSQHQPRRAKVDTSVTTATAPTQDRVTSPTPTPARSPPAGSSIRAASSEGTRLSSPTHHRASPTPGDARQRLSSPPPVASAASAEAQRAAAALAAREGKTQIR
jgi:hypothetical protein